MPPKKAKTTEVAEKPKAPAKSKKPKADHSGRTVIYQKREARIYEVGSDLGPITRTVMKEIVGWEEETAEKPFGDDFLYKLPCSGKKVRWTNNDHNRQFYASWAEVMGQEHLNRRFAPKGPNGENVVIGRTGLVISAQHRFAGLDFACDRWASEAEGKHWSKLWPDEPHMETYAAFGVDESIETIQTIDYTRPRGFHDTLFSDPDVFGKKVTTKNRRVFSRMADYSIRFMWHRVGADLDAFSPHRTPSEMGSFLSRHGRLKELVKHVNDENVDNRLTKVLNTGSLTGFAYLCGVSATDPEKYQKHDDPSEKQLDFSRWDQAETFVTVLGSGEKGDLGAVYNKLGSMVNGESKASTGERIAILTKAWLLFVEGKKVTVADLELEYAKDSLINVPKIGGIDRGEPSDSDEENDENDVSPEQVADEKAKVDEEHVKAKAGSGKEKALLAELASRREENPGRVLVFKDLTGPYRLFGADAISAAKALHAPMAKVHGTDVDAVDVDPIHLEAAVRKLAKAGHQLVLLTQGEDGFVTSSDLKPKPVVPGGGK